MKVHIPVGVNSTVEQCPKTQEEEEEYYMEFVSTDKHIFPKWVTTLRKTERKQFNLFLQQIDEMKELTCNLSLP